MDVDVTDLSLANEKILNLCASKKSAYICVANVHMCMEAFDSIGFCNIINNADLILPDGRPLSIVQKLLGNRCAQQVRGQDIMKTLCNVSKKNSINIGLYGGSSNEVLDLVKKNLGVEFPDIKITYSYSPPFRPLNEEEDADVIKKINKSGVDILFVGIGCPKQEIWMASHKNALNCVMLGVGAAFDFVAGSKKDAPRWVQCLCLEWLFRLISEPGRLWKRYLKHNPRFVMYFLQQWLFSKNFDKRL